MYTAYYLIDGYNLIFSFAQSKESLQTLRQKIIRALQKQFAQHAVAGTLVFDGAHKRDEESGLSYSSPLIIAYTPIGQSADEYIIERLEMATNPKQITVVTNDRGLRMHVKSHGAKIQSNDAFIHWLKKRNKTRREVEPMDTEQNIDRLLKIFEKRLKEEGS